MIYSAGPLKGTSLYRTTAGNGGNNLLQNDTRAEYETEFTGWVQGDVYGGVTPAEITVSGRAGALNDRSRAEMSFYDTDGHHDMQVSVDSRNTLHITNKSASPEAGEKGKAAVEVPLITGSGSINIPPHDKIGRVDVTQGMSSTQVRLYPVGDHGNIQQNNVIVYQTGNGALFMEQA